MAGARAREKLAGAGGEARVPREEERRAGARGGQRASGAGGGRRASGAGEGRPRASGVRGLR